MSQLEISSLADQEYMQDSLVSFSGVGNNEALRKGVEETAGVYRPKIRQAVADLLGVLLVAGK